MLHLVERVLFRSRHNRREIDHILNLLRTENYSVENALIAEMLRDFVQPWLRTCGFVEQGFGWTHRSARLVCRHGDVVSQNSDHRLLISSHRFRQKRLHFLLQILRGVILLLLLAEKSIRDASLFRCQGVLELVDSPLHCGIKGSALPFLDFRVLLLPLFFLLRYEVLLALTQSTKCLLNFRRRIRLVEVILEIWLAVNRKTNRDLPRTNRLDTLRCRCDTCQSPSRRNLLVI